MIGIQNSWREFIIIKMVGPDKIRYLINPAGYPFDNEPGILGETQGGNRVPNAYEMYWNIVVLMY